MKEIEGKTKKLKKNVINEIISYVSDGNISCYKKAEIGQDAGEPEDRFHASRIHFVSFTFTPE